MQIVQVKQDAVLRSAAPLDITGMHFVVHPLATLTIEAPAADIKRAKV